MCHNTREKQESLVTSCLQYEHVIYSNLDLTLIVPVLCFSALTQHLPVSFVGLCLLILSVSVHPTEMPSVFYRFVGRITVTQHGEEIVR